MHESEYERLCMHPVVAHWIFRKGYAYSYNRSIGQRLRPDFIVYTSSIPVIVECKTSAEKIDNAIKQIRLYAKIFNQESQLAIVVPDGEFNPVLRRILMKQGIKLHGVSGVPPFADITRSMWSYSTDWPGKMV